MSCRLPLKASGVIQADADTDSCSMQVTLTIDGRLLGYNKILTFPKSAVVFRHFLTADNIGQLMEEKFLFGTPEGAIRALQARQQQGSRAGSACNLLCCRPDLSTSGPGQGSWQLWSGPCTASNQQASQRPAA